MKKTLNIDQQLLKRARKASGAATDTETVREGLQWLLHHYASQRMMDFAGSEPDAQDVPRRREPPAPRRAKRAKRHAA